jgi:hypothetical protein
VYDRDAHPRGEFVRGDMYIRDMRNTKGHVAGLTGGAWHPSDKCVPPLGRCWAAAGPLLGC